MTINLNANHIDDCNQEIRPGLSFSSEQSPILRIHPRLFEQSRLELKGCYEKLEIGAKNLEYAAIKYEIAADTHSTFCLKFILSYLSFFSNFSYQFMVLEEL